MSGRGGWRPSAVTFDFWNTLCFEEIGTLAARRHAAWLGLLEEAGVAVRPDRVWEAFGSAWNAHQAAWHANRQFLADEAAAHALEQLGVAVPDDLAERLTAAFAGAGEHFELRLTPAIEECLRTLAAAGVKLGIVCDVGFTSGVHLRGFLDRRGLLELFDGWAFSDEVGVYKPAAGAFRHALDALGGVPPEQAAHVGDLKRTDIAGARGFGMRAVRYVGVFDDADGDGPEGDLVLADHAKLPAALGLGD
ncbi:MAG: HAD-superfamily hydrolase, subfamily variant 1 [Solirubrobacterales bacterium]|nr:HAD-superfamily hydrolase, subfamily variant 1 [Solirubrobacterales bacterium]